jgi:hypothetical protein
MRAHTCSPCQKLQLRAQFRSHKLQGYLNRAHAAGSQLHCCLHSKTTHLAIRQGVVLCVCARVWECVCVCVSVWSWRFRIPWAAFCSTTLLMTAKTQRAVSMKVKMPMTILSVRLKLICWKTTAKSRCVCVCVCVCVFIFACTFWHAGICVTRMLNPNRQYSTEAMLRMDRCVHCSLRVCLSRHSAGLTRLKNHDCFIGILHRLGRHILALLFVSQAFRGAFFDIFLWTSSTYDLMFSNLGTRLL